MPLWHKLSKNRCCVLKQAYAEIGLVVYHDTFGTAMIYGRDGGCRPTGNFRVGLCSPSLPRGPRPLPWSQYPLAAPWGRWCLEKVPGHSQTQDTPHPSPNCRHAKLQFKKAHSWTVFHETSDLSSAFVAQTVQKPLLCLETSICWDWACWSSSSALRSVVFRKGARS